MAVDLGSVYTGVELRLDRFDAGLKQLDERVSGMERTLKGRMDKVSGDLARSMQAVGQTASLYITAPLAALGVASVQAATRMDSLRRGLTAVSGSAAETERQMKRLREVAKLPGLGMEEAVRGSINLQAAGMSAQRAERALMAFGNALATVGKGKAELDLVNLALTQISNKTTGFGQDLRQLQEHLPQVRKVMMETFGTADTERIAKMGVTGEQLVDRLVTAFEKLPKVTGGIQNSFENFSDSANRALTSIGNILLPSVGHALESLSERLDGFATSLKGMPSEFQNAFAGLAVGGAIIGPALIGLSSLTKAIETLRASAVTPILLRVGAVVAIAYAVGSMIKDALDPAKSRTGKFFREMGLFGAGAQGVPGQLDYSGRPSARVAPTDPPVLSLQNRIRELQFYSASPGAYDTPQMKANRARAIRDYQAQLQALIGAQAHGPAAVTPPVALTGPGLMVTLQQRLNQVSGKIRDLTEKAATATTNAQRNALGKQIQALNTEKTRLDTLLEKFDPEKIAAKQKQQQEKAKRLSEETLKTRADTLRLLKRQFDAERLEAEAEFRQKLKDGMSRERASAWYSARLKNIADREKEELAKQQKETEKRQKETLEKNLQRRRGLEALRDLDLPNLSAMGATLDITRFLKNRAWSGGLFPGLGSWMTRYGADLAYNRFRQQQQQQALQERVMGSFGGLGAGLTGIAERMGASVLGATAQMQRLRRESLEKFRFQFSWMREFAGNLADEFYAGFAGGLEKLFGKTFLGRAISRTLDKALSSLLDSALEHIFKGGGGGGKKQPTGAANVGQAIGGGLLNLGISAVTGGIFGGIKHLFGFDDAINDSRAAKWGYDFGNLFARGAVTGASAPLAAAAGGVNIHIGTVSMQSEMDVGRVARQLAWHVKQELRAQVGRG